MPSVVTLAAMTTRHCQPEPELGVLGYDLVSGDFLRSGFAADLSLEGSFRFQSWGAGVLRFFRTLAGANCNWKSKKSMAAITQNSARKGLYFAVSGRLTRDRDAILLW